MVLIFVFRFSCRRSLFLRYRIEDLFVLVYDLLNSMPFHEKSSVYWPYVCFWDLRSWIHVFWLIVIYCHLLCQSNPLWLFLYYLGYQVLDPCVFGWFLWCFMSFLYKFFKFQIVSSYLFFLITFLGWESSLLIVVLVLLVSLSFFLQDLFFFFLGRKLWHYLFSFSLFWHVGVLVTDPVF